ncbi:MAG: Asp-tRNA(Asn)/Glu-tRNA(Gln) amidotransferase subunit GatB [Archaeoglobi archaeon]|nr:Asp-tRNA(Asn)/Glu-tRNA(Gln) amidotransferase subunit GatB [Candidatus Mnemosynella sp.]
MKVLIGLEVHVQLNKLKSKMFCSTPTNYHHAPPNTVVCPICLGLPGTMPTINRRAVESAVKVALALNAEIQERTMFYRKNYFYPDLPKGFQISQYDFPVGLNGYVIIDGDEGEKKVRIKRIHMEEDPGRLVHLGRIDKAKYTLIDYNRSGMPLLEIVTEPDMNSPKEARAFISKLRSILEYLDVFEGSLEGAMRVDANVSIEGGARVEIKNISSFKGVEKALSFEITRQKNLLRRGVQPKMETRHFDEAQEITVSLRVKEEESDYRYFPEPDLPPMDLSGWAEKLKAELPELPDARRERLIAQYRISVEHAKILTGERALADYFERVASQVSPKLAAAWISDVLKGELNYRDMSITECFPPEKMVELLKLLEEDMISDKAAVMIIRKMLDEGGDPREIMEREGLKKVKEDILPGVISSVIEENEKAVNDYLSGKKEAINYLVGQVMKKLRGRADASRVYELLERRLNEIDNNRKA